MESSHRECPLCQSDDFVVLMDEEFDLSKVDEYSFSSRKTPEFMHHKMVVCGECDLAYANPVPNLEWVQTNYIKAHFDTAHESAHAADNHSRLLDKVLPYVPERQAALDIGAGDGAFLSKLLQRGFTKIEGVEPSHAPINQAPETVRKYISQGFFKGSHYDSDSFDLVTCFQVLEHVDDISNLIDSIYRILKPGGVFLSASHNYRALSARLLKNKSPIFDIEHLQLFSLKSCKIYYDRCGYKDIHVEPMTNIYPLNYWIRLLPFPTLLRIVIQNTLRITKSGDLRIPIRAGNLWAWGKKPKR